MTNQEEKSNRCFNSMPIFLCLGGKLRETLQQEQDGGESGVPGKRQRGLCRPTTAREGRFSSLSARSLELPEALQDVVIEQHKLCGSPYHCPGPCGSLPAWCEGCSTAQTPALKLRIFSLQYLRLQSGGGPDDRSVTPWFPAPGGGRTSVLFMPFTRPLGGQLPSSPLRLLISVLFLLLFPPFLPLLLGSRGIQTAQVNSLRAGSFKNASNLEILGTQLPRRFCLLFWSSWNMSAWAWTLSTAVAGAWQWWFSG